MKLCDSNDIELTIDVLVSFTNEKTIENGKSLLQLSLSAESAPRDLASAIARVNGASSWQTASWLLVLLSIVLIASIALLLVKQVRLKLLTHSLPRSLSLSRSRSL